MPKGAGDCGPQIKARPRRRDQDALRACSTACCASRFVGWALRCLRTYEEYACAGSSRSALASIRSPRLANTLSGRTSPTTTFSESAFKTLKYRPDFSERFGCLQDARTHCAVFFDWYNHEHHHGALGLCTPIWSSPDTPTSCIHSPGHFVAHPERVTRGLPAPPLCPPRSGSNNNKPHREVSTQNSAL